MKKHLISALIGAAVMTAIILGVYGMPMSYSAAINQLNTTGSIEITEDMAFFLPHNPVTLDDYRAMTVIAGYYQVIILNTLPQE